MSGSSEVNKSTSQIAENTEELVKTDEQKSEESATPTEKQNQSSGLHFSSREEAIQFGLSRFTSEEIAIYNQAAKNGLTPEQEKIAIQMAYSRFSSEEIAALEKALK